MNELDEIISTKEDIEKARKELSIAIATDNQQFIPEKEFTLGVLLINSDDIEETKKGLQMFHKIADKYTCKRDALYYLALGSCKIHDYKAALNYVDYLLDIDANDQQTLSLKEVIKKKENEHKKDFITTAATIIGVSAAASVFSPIAGICMGAYMIASSFHKPKDPKK